MKTSVKKKASYYEDCEPYQKEDLPKARPRSHSFSHFDKPTMRRILVVYCPWCSSTRCHLGYFDVESGEAVSAVTRTFLKKCFDCSRDDLVLQFKSHPVQISIKDLVTIEEHVQKTTLAKGDLTDEDLKQIENKIETLNVGNTS